MLGFSIDAFMIEIEHLNLIGISELKIEIKLGIEKKGTHLTLSSKRPDLPDHFTISLMRSPCPLSIFYRREPISNCSLSLHVLFYIFSLFLWPDLTSAWPQQWRQHASKPGCVHWYSWITGTWAPGGSSPSRCRWLVTDSFPGGGLGACDSAGPPWFAQSFETDRLGI